MKGTSTTRVPNVDGQLISSSGQGMKAIYRGDVENHVKRADQISQWCLHQRDPKLASHPTLPTPSVRATSYTQDASATSTLLSTAGLTRRPTGLVAKGPVLLLGPVEGGVTITQILPWVSHLLGAQPPAAHLSGRASFVSGAQAVYCQRKSPRSGVRLLHFNYRASVLNVLQERRARSAQ